MRNFPESWASSILWAFPPPASSSFLHLLLPSWWNTPHPSSLLLCSFPLSLLLKALKGPLVWKERQWFSFNGIIYNRKKSLKKRESRSHSSHCEASWCSVEEVPGSFPSPLSAWFLSPALLSGDESQLHRQVWGRKSKNCLPHGQGLVRPDVSETCGRLWGKKEKGTKIKMQDGVTERDFIRLGKRVSSKTGECQKSPLNGQERHK